MAGLTVGRRLVVKFQAGLVTCYVAKVLAGGYYLVVDGGSGGPHYYRVRVRLGYGFPV